MKLNPWAAEALKPADKQKLFAATYSLQKERHLIGATGMLYGVIGLGIGAVCVLGSLGLAMTLVPLKTVDHQMYLNNTITGQIEKPVSLDRAPDPRTFTEANDRHYLRLLIENHENWQYETDKARDTMVKVLSSPEAQAIYLEERKKPNYVGVVLGKTGHVETQNYHYHREMDGKNLTRSYRVYYEKVTYQGDVVEKKEPWTASIDFQWHPELPRLAEDYDRNPGGFQALRFSFNSDAPETTRQ